MTAGYSRHVTQPLIMRGSQAERGGGRPYYLAAAMYAWEYLFPDDPKLRPEIGNLVSWQFAVTPFSADLPAARFLATIARLLAEPPLFQICLGIPWGAPADTTSMKAFVDQLPTNCHWAGFGISRMQMPMVAQAIPSYAPHQAASHFNKLECFCFNQYTLDPGEKKQWPVAFVIDPKEQMITIFMAQLHPTGDLTLDRQVHELAYQAIND